MNSEFASELWVHPFCPPDDFRRVHFCPEKSQVNDLTGTQFRDDGQRFIVSADEKLTAFGDLTLGRVLFD